MLDIDALLARAGVNLKAVTAADPLVISAEAAASALAHNDARNAADYLPPHSTPFMAGLALGLALAAPAEVADLCPRCQVARFHGSVSAV